MAFTTPEEYQEWLSACVDRCMNPIISDEIDVVCSNNYVNCTLHVGYDPKDKCNQTCKEQHLAKSQVKSCENQCEMNTDAEEEQNQHLMKLNITLGGYTSTISSAKLPENKSNNHQY